MTKQPALGPAEYVSALYRLCLHREPDPEGLAAWTQHLAETGDATAVLVGLMQSDEAQQVRDRALTVDLDLVGAARAALGRRPRIVDVGAQSLDGTEHVYAGVLAVTDADVIGFDPLEDRLVERRTAEGGQGSLTLLPYALGDGEEHVLHVNDDDATSSLFPLDEAHNAVFNHLSTLRTVARRPVTTHRLDDVLPAGPVDLLKLDVQGAELLVLRGGPRTLESAAVVHSEVEFAPLYSGQPLFEDVSAHLRAAGFSLMDLLITTRYHYVDGAGPATQDRLLWADALFFRDDPDREQAAAQALLAAAAYGKPSLAAHLLRRCAQSP